MKSVTKKQKKRLRLVVVLVIASILIGGSFVYLNDYYHGDMVAIENYNPENQVEKQTLADNMTAYVPKEIKAGFVFYPGGKVESISYEPLMEALASEGIVCVLVDMPFRLAVLDVNAAEGIQEYFPDVDLWYIGGHSLGGSMAASYLSKHQEDYAGLILLGSYSTADFTEGRVDVLSVYGSEDGVMNREKYNGYLNNLPTDYTEIVIEGGCHAYFGMYGAQDGDGIPQITNEEQILRTVQSILNFVTGV